MKRSIPANRNRTLQGLSDVGTGWICQFSREEDGQSEKKKTNHAKALTCCLGAGCQPGLEEKVAMKILGTP